MRVLYLVAADVPTSIPIELFAHMEREDTDFDIRLVAFYDFPNKPKNGFTQIHDCVKFRKRNPLPGLMRLYKIIKTYRPQVLHVHHGLSACCATVFAKICRVPVIIKTEHRNHDINRLFAQLLTLITFLFCDKIICNSLSTMQSFTLLERWIGLKKSIIVYNGIDPNLIDKQLDKAGANKSEANSFRLVATTRLIPLKNMDRLLEAFAQVFQKHPEISLIIMGEGYLRADLEARVRELKAEEAVHFLGLVTRDEVFRQLGKADLFCMVPLSEGFCNALIEAMVASCPVVASNIDALREVTGLSDNLLVDPKNVNEIAEGIEQFVTMGRDKSAAIGKKNRAFAIDRYSLQLAASKHIKMYHDFLHS